MTLTDYELVNTEREVRSAVQELGRRKIVGLDFETTGLDLRRDTALLLGIDEFIIPCNSSAFDWAELVRPLVESKDTVKVEYNASFEGMVFQHRGIRQRRVVDPMLGDMLLNAGVSMPRGHFGLGQALSRYLYVTHDKSLQTSFVGADAATFVPTEAQCAYLRRDVGYLPALSEAVARRIAEQGLMSTWKLENAYSQVVAMMQYHGVLVDVEGYRLELDKVNAEYDALERKVSEALTPSILEVRRRRYQALKGPEDTWRAERDAYKALLEVNTPEHATKQDRRDAINANIRIWNEAHPRPQQAKMNHSPILVTSPDQIHEALTELGIKVENTEKETLILAKAGRPSDQVELLTDLGELSVVKKIRANEGPELLLRLQDGNLLTTRYGQLRARTGRLGSSKWRDKGRCAECLAQLIHVDIDEEASSVTCPGCGRESSLKNFGKQWGANKQNLTPRFKRYVKPGEGRKFVIYDYSQIELRVAAELILQHDPSAKDALVKAFRDGLDPHCLTGEEVTGIPYAEFHRVACIEKDPVKERLRRGMKEVNFGTTFGIGAPQMAVKIYVKVGDTTPFDQHHVEAAQAGINAFWRVNPTLAVIRDRIGADAIAIGFSETLGGRRRYYETRGLAKWQLRGIERQAISSRIQGTAADIAKLAQNLIYDAIADNDPDAWLWAVVHDELALECDEADAEDWDQLMPALMDQAFTTYITHIESGLKPGTGVQTRWQH